MNKHVFNTLKMYYRGVYTAHHWNEKYVPGSVSKEYMMDSFFENWTYNLDARRKPKHDIKFFDDAVEKGFLIKLDESDRLIKHGYTFKDIIRYKFTELGKQYMIMRCEL